MGQVSMSTSDHIESIWHPRIVQQPEPFLCAAHNPFLLASGQAGVGWTERIGGARLHFHENQCLFASIAADQINFASLPRSKIFIKDTKPVPAEVIGGHFLTIPPEDKMWRENSSCDHARPEPNGKGSTSEKPARTISDESGKVRESVSFQGAPSCRSLCSDQSCIEGTRYAIFSSYGLA